MRRHAVLVSVFCSLDCGLLPANCQSLHKQPGTSASIIIEAKFRERWKRKQMLHHMSNVCWFACFVWAKLCLKRGMTKRKPMKQTGLRQFYVEDVFDCFCTCEDCLYD